MISRYLKYVSVFIVSFSISTLLSSGLVFSQESLQKEFEKSYDSSDYKNAIIFMEQKIQNEKNGTNYYNLGNAYYKNHELGKAFASYLKARELAPLDSSIKANINFIKDRLVDSLETEYVTTTDMFFFWNFFINKKTSWFILTILLACFFISILVLVLKQQKRTPRIITTVLFILNVIWSISFVVKYNQMSWTAVIGETVEVKSSPNSESSSLFSLHEGAPVMIQDKLYEGNWYKIKLSDGKEGWIQKDELWVY